MWVTLKHLLLRRRSDLSPARALDLLSRLHSADIILPTTEGREIRLRRITTPSAEQQTLLDQLGLSLPKRLRFDTECSADFAQPNAHSKELSRTAPAAVTNLGQPRSGDRMLAWGDAARRNPRYRTSCVGSPDRAMEKPRRTGQLSVQQMAVSSVDSLQQIIADGKSSAASRVSGIRTNLDYAYRAIELEDIEERLTRIEEAIAGGQVGGDA